MMQDAAQDTMPDAGRWTVWTLDRTLEAGKKAGR